MSQLKPYCPKPFPPHHLTYRNCRRLLSQAHALCQEYAALLMQEHNPLDLLSALSFAEAAVSLESQNHKLSLEHVLQKARSSTKTHPNKLSQIFNYRKALLTTFKRKPYTPLSKKELCAIQKLVKQDTPLKHALGCYRKEQNWIGPVGCSMEEAYFYPPEAHKVPVLMRQWFRYSKAEAPDPLIQLALLFAQLLIIHPFMDGNGRLARVLVPLFLFHKGILPVPALFLSRYFRAHRLRYFQALLDITETQKWEAWGCFFLKGLNSSLRHHLRTLRALLALKQKCPPMPTTLSRFLFENPFFTQSAFRKAGGSTATLKDLMRKKWVRKIKKGGYVLVPLWKILN